MQALESMVSDGSRSHAFLTKLNKGNKMTLSTKAAINSNIKVLHLVILGQREMFGLEEIMELKSLRQKTVECITLKANCYYISLHNFIRCINEFKFSQAVIEEQIVKYQHYCDRMAETHEFL